MKTTFSTILCFGRRCLLNKNFFTPLVVEDPHSSWKLDFPTTWMMTSRDAYLYRYTPNLPAFPLVSHYTCTIHIDWKFCFKSYFKDKIPENELLKIVSKHINLQQSIPKPASTPSLRLLHMEGPENKIISINCKSQMQWQHKNTCFHWMASRELCDSWVASRFLYWPVKALLMLFNNQMHAVHAAWLHCWVKQTCRNL